jgi:DNA polymerase III alpha subunit
MKTIKEKLKKMSESLSLEEQSYLKEEIKAFTTQDEWKHIKKLIDSGEKLEENPNNILTLHLLGLAPKPEKLFHRYELADMADIDLDFSPEGRDKIKAWLKEKFGEKNCVSIGTYGTLGVKGSVQEVSRAYGIKPFEYIKVSKLVSDDDKDLDVDEIKEKYPQVEQFLKKHPEVEDVMIKLIGMKKNIGQHAGGFIVSSDNAYENIPVVKANKGDVTGWQETGAVKELEALGWIKVDILGLACVEQVRLCVEEINRKNPGAINIDPYLLPVDDPKVYDFINTLELENVFQMESKIFKEAVRKIKPRSLQDISNISTLVRPGAAEINDYIKMKNVKRREPKCLHHVYDHTRGLMIYQEQLMQVLMVLGDFTIFDADKVRRLVRKIGKSKTSDENREAMLKESEIYHKKYLKIATQKIIEEDEWGEKEAKEYAEVQWKQLMLQAKYAFNMPHSYAYSLMGYVQAYLKCYYPVEFWTATLNTIERGQEKHNQSSLGKYINAIQNSKINVHPPDINLSGINFESTNGDIYFALSYIKDVSKGAEDIIKMRPYKDWEDFLDKVTQAGTSSSKNRNRIYSNEEVIDNYEEFVAKESQFKTVNEFKKKIGDWKCSKIKVTTKNLVVNACKSGIDINNNDKIIDWIKNSTRDSFANNIKGAINKRIVRGLIFSGAVDFEDDIDARPYKWLLYLAQKKKNKKVRAEIDEYQNNMPPKYELIHIEYDYCKYSFTGIDAFLKNSKYKNIKTISERDLQKKLWVLIGYISDISVKKSKKSGNEYVLITVTDFRDTISVFAFGSNFRDRILGTYNKGQLVKIGIKNDSNWLKLPWDREYNNQFPIEVIE